MALAPNVDVNKMWDEIAEKYDEPTLEDYGECDICGQTKHVAQLELCEVCVLIVCDDCRKTHKHLLG